MRYIQCDVQNVQSGVLSSIFSVISSLSNVESCVHNAVRVQCAVDALHYAVELNTGHLTIVQCSVQLCVLSDKSAAAITSLLQKTSHPSEDDGGDDDRHHVTEKYS